MPSLAIARARSLGAVAGMTGLSMSQQIRALFANGEQGAWYDPSDFSTLFQDAAGITPVTALGQSVGLILDKSHGLVLGPELVTNGDFSDGSTGWVTSDGWTFAGGKAEFLVASAEFRAINQEVSATVLSMRCFEVSFDLVVTSGELSLSMGGYITDRFTTGGPKRVRRFAHQALANKRVYFTASPGFTGSVTNISVHELPGNHASQPTAASRPKIEAGNEIVYDGVDDKLTTNFASSLGSDCTVIRSIKGTGASILTGQTIGAGAWDDSTDHCGLLIIDRALTLDETALVTTWANMRAGV